MSRHHAHHIPMPLVVIVGAALVLGYVLGMGRLIGGMP